MKINNTIELPISELKTALAGLGKVVSKRSTLPVLQSIRITRDKDGQVSLHGTDLDSFATYRTLNVQEGEPVEFLIPMEQVIKTAKTTRDKVNLYPEGKNAVIIQTFVGNTPVEQKINTLDPKEFPPEPRINKPAVTLPENVRDSIIKEAWECASEDSSRYVLQGVFLDVRDPKAHYVVGTDGRHLYSANSFCFDLNESVIVPTRKFLGWNGWWTKGSALIAVEPPEMDKKKKEQIKPGYLRFSTDNWTFTTRMIEGAYPNWKQVLVNTAPNTTIQIPENHLEEMLAIIARIPGDYEPNYPITLNVSEGTLVLQGCNRDQKQPVSVPVVHAVVEGKPMRLCVNRYYLAKALRFGLNTLDIVDEFTPITCKAGGKKLIISPLRLEGPVTVKAKAEDAPSSEPAPESQPVQSLTPATTTPPPEEANNPSPSTPAPETTNPPAPSSPATESANHNERTDMSKTTATATSSTTTENHETADSPMKKAMQHVEKIKDGLKAVLHDINELLSSLKTAEREQKASDKEIEAVREKLREIQSVTI